MSLSRAVPLYGAAGSKWLRSVFPEAEEGQEGPEQGVEPHQADGQGDVPPLDPLTWGAEGDTTQQGINYSCSVGL